MPTLKADGTSACRRRRGSVAPSRGAGNIVRMSNVHRFKPRPKAPPPRKRLPWGRAAWLPWALVLAGAALLTLVGAGDLGTVVVALAIVLLGGWLDGRARL
jgi:hypothetical protein